MSFLEHHSPPDSPLGYVLHPLGAPCTQPVIPRIAVVALDPHLLARPVHQLQRLGRACWALPAVAVTLCRLGGLWRRRPGGFEGGRWSIASSTRAPAFVRSGHGTRFLSVAYKGFDEHSHTNFEVNIG